MDQFRHSPTNLHQGVTMPPEKSFAEKMEKAKNDPLRKALVELRKVESAQPKIIHPPKERFQDRWARLATNKPTLTPEEEANLAIKGIVPSAKKRVLRAPRKNLDGIVIGKDRAAQNDQ